MVDNNHLNLLAYRVTNTGNNSGRDSRRHKSQTSQLPDAQCSGHLAMCVLTWWLNVAWRSGVWTWQRRPLSSCFLSIENLLNGLLRFTHGCNEL